MELRERVAETYCGWCSDYCEADAKLCPIALASADRLLAIPEISQALKLMDMIPEGEFCTDCGLRSRNIYGVLVTYCPVVKQKLEGRVMYHNEWEYIKIESCPKPYKGETE